MAALSPGLSPPAVRMPTLRMVAMAQSPVSSEGRGGCQRREGVAVAGSKQDLEATARVGPAPATGPRLCTIARGPRRRTRMMPLESIVLTVGALLVAVLVSTLTGSLLGRRLR